MTLVINTTSLQDSIIVLISSIVKPPSTPQINEIHLRNKQFGAHHGNWGRFYPLTYHITLCIPQDIDNYHDVRTYTKKNVFYKNRYDFLAAILGHEYYHAWQWVNEQDVFYLKEYIEVGAERYEEVALQKWIDWKIANNWKEPVESKSQRVATKQVKWRDYK